MQVVFFGSSPFSNIVLQKLLEAKCDIVGVVTNEDKPAGRGLKLTPNPVKVLAEKHNLVVYTSPPTPLLIQEREAIGLVAAYGRIIKQDVLDSFGGKIYNIHPSLLPKYRGASPLQQQILDGVKETGVTIIQMDAQMDHGPIVAQEKDVVRPDDTWKTLGTRLFAKGAEIFLTTKEMEYRPQDESQATYTKKLTRQDGFITWEEFQNPNSKPQIELKKRAFAGWPGVWTINPAGERIKLS